VENYAIIIIAGLTRKLQFFYLM